VETKFFLADGRTDEHEEANSHFKQFLLKRLKIKSTRNKYKKVIFHLHRKLPFKSFNPFKNHLMSAVQV